MKEAVKRNPDIVLYGLPWAWAGWLGFGTNSPYANVTATADYTAKWIECGRYATSTPLPLRNPPTCELDATDCVPLWLCPCTQRRARFEYLRDRAVEYGCSYPPDSTFTP